MLARLGLRYIATQGWKSMGLGLYLRTYLSYLTPYWSRGCRHRLLCMPCFSFVTGLSG